MKILALDPAKNCGWAWEDFCVFTIEEIRMPYKINEPQRSAGNTTAALTTSILLTKGTSHGF